MGSIIAIVGRPNVGKSTLFNRLTRSRNALVDDRPGITRDRLHSSIHYDGVPFTIVDTGGFEDIGQDPLLGKVRDQVEKAIKEADCVILMADGREGLMPGDQEMAYTLRRAQKKAFLAVNKIDGPEHDHLIADFYSLCFEPVYHISAAHGYGVRSLMQDVIKSLPIIKGEKEDEGQIRVAILGKPNVGKSSLINRVLGSERLLVSDAPGTTRDAVDTLFRYRGKDYLLIDTAGLRRKSRVKEKVEKFSMIKALKSIERCHVAAILLDAEAGVSEQDARISGYVFEKGKGMVLAVNKWDLIKGNQRKRSFLNNEIDRQLKFISFAPRVNLSALTGERVVKLFDKIDVGHEQFSRKFSTSSINKALQNIIEKHPPPRIGRGRLKFFYATQIRTKPPTFMIFVNRPDMVHFSYERFLINQLRENLRLESAPVKIKFKKK
jgi:GTP-binding protein